MDRNPNKTARKIAEEALSHLSAELQAGRSEAFLNYLRAIGLFREYSWQNVLLIAAQRPDATRVAGIHTWHHLGHSVKVSEKGILILAPVEGKNASHIDDPFRRTGFRSAYVFDVSQTQGKPLPEVEPEFGGPEEYRERLQHLIAKRVVEPQYAGPVAYTIARGLGLEDNGASVSFAAQQTTDSRALARSLSVIHETSSQILAELLPEERTSTGRATETAPGHPTLPLHAEEFSKLHLEYRDRLIQSITGMVRDRDKAEDIVARAFQVAWQKREEFRGEALPTTWIETIARREAWQSQSRERTVQFDYIDREDAREIAAPELVTDELEQQDDRLRVQAALAQLPAKQRRALAAHLIEGLSIREIARRERVPFGTVLSRIHKGKQLLRQAWEESFPAPQAYVSADSNPSARSQKTQARRTGESQRLTTESPEPMIWNR